MNERTIQIKLKKNKLPKDIRGFCVQKEPGRYGIVVNADLTDQEQTAAFLHEMLHVYHGDYEKGGSVSVIEQERHNQLIEILKVLMGDGE